MTTTNTNPIATSNQPTPILPGRGDVMQMLAVLLHELGQQKGEELRGIADEQKQIFENRKKLGTLKQKLSNITANGYVNPEEWDEFETMAKDMGFDTSSDIFTAMRGKTRHGMHTDIRGTTATAEGVEAANQGLDKIKDAIGFRMDTLGDDETARSFDLQKAMHAFTTDVGEAKKVLEKAERLV